MWGMWFIIAYGATAGIVALVVGLAFGGWPVLIALALFAAIGAALLAGASWQRSGEYVERGDETAAGEGNPRSSGAPASGEGG